MPKNAKNICQIINYGEGTQEWLVPDSQARSLGVNGIQAVGWVIPGEGYSFLWTKPSWSLLFATTSGAGEVYLGGEWQSCEVGQIYLTPVGQRCAYRKIAGVPWQVAWVMSSDLALIGVEQPRLVSSDPAPLLRVIQGLYEEDLGRAESFVMQNYVELIVAHTRRIAQESVRSLEQLRPVWELVRRELAHAWTGAQLARLAGVSEPTLRRLCQHELGRSPLEQVAFLRMRHATSLLIATSLRVGVIAEKVGYGNPLAFSTAFKRIMGVPPTHYRRSLNLS